MTPDRIITAATITCGEKHEGKVLVDLIEKSEEAGYKIEAVIGDGAYSEHANIEYTNENEIKLASKFSKNITHGNKKDDKLNIIKTRGCMCAKQDIWQLKRYGDATGCGILSMNIQGASTIFLTNMKRIIKLIDQKKQRDEAVNPTYASSFFVFLNNQ